LGNLPVEATESRRSNIGENSTASHGEVFTIFNFQNVTKPPSYDTVDVIDLPTYEE
jgi:hypothetical protein